MDDQQPPLERTALPEEWVEVDGADGRSWTIDVGFLASSWTARGRLAPRQGR
jgi:hypothetical protein